MCLRQGMFMSNLRQLPPMIYTKGMRLSSFGLSCCFIGNDCNHFLNCGWPHKGWASTPTPDRSYRDPILQSCSPRVSILDYREEKHGKLSPTKMCGVSSRVPQTRFVFLKLIAADRAYSFILVSPLYLLPHLSKQGLIRRSKMATAHSGKVSCNIQIPSQQPLRKRANVGLDCLAGCYTTQKQTTYLSRLSTPLDARRFF